MSELRTPLQIATQAQDLGGIQQRFAKGDSPDDNNHLGIPVFFDALKTNNIAVLDTYLAKDVNLKLEYNSGGYTTLIYASLYCEQQTIAWLLDQGLDIHVKTPLGITVMHVAAQRGDVAVAEFLYKAGANPFTETTHGEIPLLVSLKAKHGLAVFRFLLQCYQRQGVAIQKYIMPCLASIIGSQQADAIAAVNILLPHMPEIPTTKSIADYMAIPGHYTSGQFRSLERTLSMRMSESVFALLESQRISRSATTAAQSLTWHGIDGL